MSTNEPTAMKQRPFIRRVTYISAEGNPCVFQRGIGCSEIREVTEDGEFALIPWLEVWDDQFLVARINQHKVEHILYERSQPTA